MKCDHDNYERGIINHLIDGACIINSKLYILLYLCFYLKGAGLF